MYILYFTYIIFSQLIPPRFSTTLSIQFHFFHLLKKKAEWLAHTQMKENDYRFVSVIYPWTRGLPWYMNNIPSATLLKKIDFLFSRSYELRVDSWLKLVLFAYLYFSCWDFFVWFKFVKFPWCCHSLWEFICESVDFIYKILLYKPNLSLLQSSSSSGEILET